MVESDFTDAARSDPPLTPLRQPIQRAGQVTAETLIEKIEVRASQPRRIILPTELVIRASRGSMLVNVRSKQKEVVPSR